MTTSAAEYERIALQDPSAKWELVCGRLRRKPEMTTEHGYAARTLGTLLGRQLDLNDYTVGTDACRLRISSGTYYVPDVCVVPMEYVRRLHERPGTFEVYEEPVPLVVEVWSPSTGDYDVDDKLREYQARGDLEVWRLHPYERTLRMWRRRPDGSYAETVITSGTVEPVALPGVTIELAALFL
jgi:Uma2 family endonuclease